MSQLKRSMVFLSATMFGVSVLAACGGGAEKRLTDQESCDLLSADAISEATGTTFAEGTADGKQCFYAPDGSPTAAVTIGAGVPSAGYPEQESPPGAPEPEEIDIDGVMARQASNGDMCLVDLWLDPGSKEQVVSVVFTDANRSDEEVCTVSGTLASEILAGLPG